MNRIKIVVGGLVAFFLILLIAGGIFMLKSRGAAGERQAGRDSALASLQQLYGVNPFPSQDNLETVRRDTDNLIKVRDLLTNSLTARDVAATQLSPSRFNQELLMSIRNMQQAAPLVKGVSAVPEGFAFGFERYTVSGAPMPREEDVPRLTQQLAIIERLMAEVYAAQVVGVQRVERDEFDMPEGGGEGSRVTGRRARRQAVSQSGSGASKMRITEFYTAQGFSLELTARQSAVAELLNRLSSMELFVVATEISMRKTNDGLREPTSLEELQAELRTKQAEGAVPAEIEEVSSKPPSQRLVAGVEIDPPIQVEIELEVYSFKRGEG